MKKPPKSPREKVVPLRRQRAVDPPPEDDDDDDELVDAGGEDQDLDEVLRALAQELGEDSNQARVHVHRIVQNGDSQRCFSCPAMQFSTETIREQWGPGTYSIMTYVRGRLRQRDRITFAEPLKPSTPTPASAPPPVVDSSRELIGRLESRLETQQTQMFELLKTIAGKGSSQDPLQVQQATLTMLASVRELMGAGAASKDDRSTLDVLLEGVKLAQKLKGGASDGESTNWSELILAAVEGLKALKEAQQPDGHAGAAAPAALTGPAGPGKPRVLPGYVGPALGGQPPASSASTSSPNEDADMMDKLQKALQFLARKAAAGSDPTLYADVALDNIDELPKLVQGIALDYIQRDDCVQRLAQLEPSIAPHREWFTQCVAEIRRLLSEQNESSELTDEPGSSDPEG